MVFIYTYIHLLNVHTQIIVKNTYRYGFREDLYIYMNTY